MKATVGIEEALFEVFRDTDLLSFQTKLAVEKQLTRLDHFADVTDDELSSYGLSAPAIRRLRNAIERRRKLAKKAKLFGTKKEKLVTIVASQLSVDSNTASCSTACLIPRENIKLMESIGEGTFAVVKRAIWKVVPGSEEADGSRVDCAVKILHDMSEQVRQDLFSEISNMQKLSHQNLVRLYGVVIGDPALMVIEFCENGALLDRLRSTSKARLLVTRLLNYAQQIACGMNYLESRGFVHRDLAARNVLLTAGEELVKICDFGLTRCLNENERLYVMSGSKKVPFSWCPPESLRFRQFSHKSDVWAFGVTLWETYTYGEDPYIGCKAVDVLKLTESGERLRMPDYCSKELYDIMNMCWNLSAESRPKFSHLSNLLQDVKFSTAVCKEPTSKNLALDEQCLALEMDEKVVLLAERDEGTCFGQSVTSRKFGTFKKSSVTLSSQKTKDKQSSSIASRSLYTNSFSMQAPGFPEANLHRREISHPIPGSWIHTGHGDTSEEKSWGYVDKIDEIYLRNPVTNSFSANNRFSSQEINFIPSVLALQDLTRIDRSESCSLGQRRRSAQDLNLPALLQTENVTVKPITLPKPARPHAAVTAQHFSIDHLFERSPKVESYQNLNQRAPTSALCNAPTTKIFQQDERAKSETKMLEIRKMNNFNGSFENYSSEFAKVFAADETVKMVGPPSRSQKSSKYDSIISIPRPLANRSSPLLQQDIAFFAGAGYMSERVANADQNVTSKTSTSSLPSFNTTMAPIAVAALANSTTEGPTKALKQHITAQQDFLNKEPIAYRQPPMFIADQMEKDKGNDPFVVNEQVKSLSLRLANKPRVLNGILHSEVDTTNLQKLSNNIANLKEGSNVPSTDSLESSQANVNLHSFICAPPSSASVVTSAIASIVLPTPVQVTSAPSFLPPPSELLLSGGNLQSNKSGAANAARATQSFRDHHPNLSSSLHDQPLFDLQQHKANNSRIRYGTNGIPILEPTPAPLMFPSSNKGSENNSMVEPTIIDLKDLDTDALIARVQSQVNFASYEQCRISLRKHNFDVENAVREIKIEKLLEIGVAGDRHLAASALDSCKWNVNAAANHLVS